MIHEIYIITSSGTTLYYYSKKRANVDKQIISSLITAFQSFSDEVFFSKIQKIDLENRRLTFLNLNIEKSFKNPEISSILCFCVSDLVDHPFSLQRFLKRILNKFIEFFNTQNYTKGLMKQIPEFDEYLDKKIKASIHPRNWLFITVGFIICLIAFYITTLIFYQKGIVEWRDFLAFSIGTSLISLSGLCCGSKLWSILIALTTTFVISPFLMYLFNESGIVSFVFSAGSLSVISGFFGGYISERLWLFKSEKYTLNWKIYILIIICGAVICLIEIFFIFPSIIF